MFLTCWATSTRTTTRPTPRTAGWTYRSDPQRVNAPGLPCLSEVTDDSGLLCSWPIADEACSHELIAVVNHDVVVTIAS
jgi:hypothetical protein